MNKNIRYLNKITNIFLNRSSQLFSSQPIDAFFLENYVVIYKVIFFSSQVKNTECITKTQHLWYSIFLAFLTFILYKKCVRKQT